MTNTTKLDLAAIVLKGGSHENPDDGLCMMEAVAYIAGEPHSDHPKCASPILTDFCISLNDRWDDMNRQRLVPFVTRIVGTRDDGKDELRGYLALDWLIRTYTPAWLDLAGLTAEATALRDLRRIDDLASAQIAGPVVRDARVKADAARAATWAAVWVAARDATRVADWAATRVADWAATRVATRDAVWVADWDAFEPAIEALRASILDLLDRMIDGRRDADEVTA